jgi:ergothioneine biosynthesis protein EgtB
MKSIGTHSNRTDSVATPDINRYTAVRRATRSLCAPLSAEDCQIQSMPDASPAKWHLAHTTWFFETFVLERWQESFRPFRPEYRVLFNSYYQTVGEQYSRPQRGLLSRPSLDEVFEYREHVDGAVARLLAVRGDDPEMTRIVELGLHHEQQHQELILTDIKHALSQHPSRPPYAAIPAATPTTAPPLTWHAFAGGICWVGHEGGEFAFDNEGPRHREIVEPFELSSRLITNEEFIAFIDDGGYQRPEVWLSDGWAAVQAQNWSAPLYWERGERGWTQFTLGGARPAQAGEPVCHLSYYEADAYARWAGARLPTEFEWEVAAQSCAASGNFVESGALRPLPSSFDAGVAQLFGDVWEWTSSAYAPYPGFQPAAGALGEYNGKFMCNQMVLRGGSCATPQSHIRVTYRNFFPPQARWQFSGIRLARWR